MGGFPGTGHLNRIVFNERWEEVGRESILLGWGLRIRNVGQGPDGLLYLLAEESNAGESDGMLLVIDRLR